MTSDTQHAPVSGATSKGTSDKDLLHHDQNAIEEDSTIDADERYLVRRVWELNAAV
jgi:hypothetical protein